jgi:hypothetical protein
VKRVHTTCSRHEENGKCIQNVIMKSSRDEIVRKTGAEIGVDVKMFLKKYGDDRRNRIDLSSSCGRQSVDQFVLVSGSPLGPMTRFYLFSSFVWQLFCCSCRAPSLTRGRVCNLHCNRWLVRTLRTNNHTIPSHQRLRSLLVAYYDSQGLRWKYSNPPPHGGIDWNKGKDGRVLLWTW